MHLVQFRVAQGGNQSEEATTSRPVSTLVVGMAMKLTIQWMVRQSRMVIRRLAVFVKPGTSDLSVPPPSWTDDEQHLGSTRNRCRCHLYRAAGGRTTGGVQRGADVVLSASRSYGHVTLSSNLTLKIDHNPNRTYSTEPY